MKYIITGGSGFVGGRVLKQLLSESESNEIVILTRGQPDLQHHKDLDHIVRQYNQNQLHKVSLSSWNPEKTEPDAELVALVDQTDFIIHLAGASVFARRWTAAYKEEMISSRVVSSNLLVSAIAAANNKPKALVSASGIGYYGDCKEDILDETRDVGPDFLAQLAQKWEQSVLAAEKYGVRVACARIGIVLGKEGGALQQMLPLFRFRVGGHIGNGNQWFPWIHADDCARSFLFACKTESLTGPFNCCSPNPVRMRDFCQILGEGTNRWSWAHAPYFALRVVLGEFADSLVASYNAVPSKLQQEGFEFNYPSFTVETVHKLLE